MRTQANRTDDTQKIVRRETFSWELFSFDNFSVLFTESHTTEDKRKEKEAIKTSPVISQMSLNLSHI